DVLGGINSAIASAVAAVPGCAFLDLAGAWGPANWRGGSGPVFVADSGVAPNDAGHADLAARIIERLRAARLGRPPASGAAAPGRGGPLRGLERWTENDWPFATAAAVALGAGVATWRLVRAAR
ncbi:MAG TPA: hypothetical protein VFA70_14475, partial [Dehalococcoidia bacterium]|nr:hypothetical protein [Dehalococcoidia bacterium]